MLNDSVTLWNTIIEEGQAEDWSKQTKIFISGKAKNLNMTIKNGDGISLKKKDFNLNGKEEFIISETRCLPMEIRITSEDKLIYSRIIPFECGE